MKKKIIKTLESTKIVLSITFFIAVVISFLVYGFVGYAPKMVTNNLSIGPASQPKEGETIDLAFLKSGKINSIYVKSGDKVKKGQMLMSLDFQDALGALEVAKANYQKIVNGATGADIDVAKAAVQTAQVNFDATTKQQNLAVELANRNLLNSSLEAVPGDASKDYIPPTITGTYLLDKEGVINLDLYYSSGGITFNISGLSEGKGMCNTITPQPIGDSGLYIKFPSSTNFDEEKWVITIPNKHASNYLSNYNAYQSALDTQKRMIDVAQATLDQANSALALKVANARPEDVAAAMGSLRVAQGVYDNNFIYAPADGVITVVNLAVGEIATANQRMISMIVKNNF